MEINRTTFNTLSVSMSVFLTGCLASVDLTREDSPLRSSERAVAVKIAKIAASQCVTYTYNSSTGERMSGNTAVYNPVSVKRLFLSDRGWYKAEIVADGVWDSAFLQENSDRFICGQKNWDSYSDTKEIKFFEFGAEQRRISN